MHFSFAQLFVHLLFFIKWLIYARHFSDLWGNSGEDLIFKVHVIDLV